MTGERLELAVQYAVNESDAPSEEFIESCVRRALPGVDGELVVRIVEESESAELNQRYRGKSGPTNVLAFPPGEMPSPAPEPRPLGDIAICAPIVAREAAAQGKALEAHWAHIVIHACLHLCGFDHQAKIDAAEMEARETGLLSELGIGDPYQSER